MKALAGLGAAALIAAAAALWSTTNSATVVMDKKPLSASADVPTFKRDATGPGAGSQH